MPLFSCCRHWSQHPWADLTCVWFHHPAIKGPNQSISQPLNICKVSSQGPIQASRCWNQATSCTGESMYSVFCMVSSQRTMSTSDCMPTRRKKADLLLLRSWILLISKQCVCPCSEAYMRASQTSLVERMTSALFCSSTVVKGQFLLQSKIFETRLHNAKEDENGHPLPVLLTSYENMTKNLHKRISSSSAEMISLQYMAMMASINGFRFLLVFWSCAIKGPLWSGTLWSAIEQYGIDFVASVRLA